MAHTHSLLVSYSCAQLWHGDFLHPNTNFMLLDFAIRMKCGFITENRCFTNLSYSCFSCISTQNCLRFHLSSAVMSWTTCSLLGFIVKNFLKMRQTVVGGIWVSRLVLRNDFFGLCKIFLRVRSTISSDVFGNPDHFLLH